MNSALGLAPLTNSLLNLLPRSAYEPEAYAASANSSTIGLLSYTLHQIGCILYSCGTPAGPIIPVEPQNDFYHTKCTLPKWKPCCPFHFGYI